MGGETTSTNTNTNTNTKTNTFKNWSWSGLHPTKPLHRSDVNATWEGRPKTYTYTYTKTNIELIQISINYETIIDLIILIIQCQDSNELFSALSPRLPSPPSWRFYMLSVRFMCRKIALISFLRHFSWINTSVWAAASLEGTRDRSKQSTCPPASTAN